MALDAEVVNLCSAINACKDYGFALQTYSSCSGHGRHPMRVWFKAETIGDLFPLLRAIDPRYGGPYREDVWTVQAQGADLPDKHAGVAFLLQSPCKGPLAYTEADVIASNLWAILANDAVLDYFKKGTSQ